MSEPRTVQSSSVRHWWRCSSLGAASSALPGLQGRRSLGRARLRNGEPAAHAEKMCRAHSPTSTRAASSSWWSKKGQPPAGRRAGSGCGSGRAYPGGGAGHRGQDDGAGPGRPVVSLSHHGRGSQTRGAGIRRGREAAVLLRRIARKKVGATATPLPRSGRRDARRGDTIPRPERHVCFLAAGAIRWKPRAGLRPCRQRSPSTSWPSRTRRAPRTPP